MNNIKRIFLSLICISCWGANFSLLKMGVKDLPPFYFTGLRLFFMGLLGVFFVQVPKKDWGKLVLLAFCLFGLPLGMTTYAVVEMDASLVALLTELEVPFALLLGVIFLKENLNKMQIFGLVLSFLGIYMVSQSPEISIKNLYSFFAVLLAALSYAIAFILTKYISLDSASMTIWSCILASPLSLLLSVLFKEPSHPILPTSNSGMMSFLISSVFSLIGFTLWNKLLKEFKVSQVVPLAMLVPISSLIFSYILLNEQTHTLALVGGGITLVGVYFQTKEKNNGLST